MDLIIFHTLFYGSPFLLFGFHFISMTQGYDADVQHTDTEAIMRHSFHHLPSGVNNNNK